MDLLKIIKDIFSFVAFSLYAFIFSSKILHGYWIFQPVERNVSSISLERKAISIQMCQFNKKKYLHVCLKSLISDPFFKNCELVIMDDHSTDGSLDIIESYAKKYKNIKIYMNKKNKGILATRINCIKRATGKYMYILDPDDKIIHGCLEFLYNLAEKHQADVINFQKYFSSKYNRRSPIERFDFVKNMVINDNRSDIFYKFRNDQIEYTMNENFIKTDLYKKAVSLIPYEIANKYICAGEDLLIFGLTIQFASKWIKISNYGYIYHCGLHDNHKSLFGRNTSITMHREMVDTLMRLLNVTISPEYYYK